MIFHTKEKDYEVIIEKKKSNKNTYIRVREDMSIYITTNIFIREKEIKKLLEESKDSIIRMIHIQEERKKSNEGFHYLGKKYDIIYGDSFSLSFGEEKVFMNKKINIDQWYKKEAKLIFQKHLDLLYHKFSRKVPYPSLRIRKMSSRWGVCNTKLKVITLNLELIKRDLKYLDYVIIHELSHLIEANHSSRFWSLVEENCPNYKEIKKEMKLF